MDKSNVPYYQVAREALIKWNGLTEEQADKIIEESSFEEIEAQVGAQNSMQYAIDAMAQFMSLNNGTKAGISGTVFGRVDAANAMVVTSGILRGYNSDIEWFDSARTTENNLNRNGYDVNKLVMNMIEAVHNGWIKDNASAFFTKKKDRGQQYQYLPIELIGWDEVKSDLLFIKPIIEAIGGEIDEKALKEELADRTILYARLIHKTGSDVYADFEDIGNDIVDHAKIERENPRVYGFLFGDSHPWSEEIREAFTDTEFVQSVIVPQLREKGFGKDEELMNRLAKTISLESAKNYGADGPKEFTPIFWDREWAEMYGYDNVANAINLRMVESDEEHEERISELDEAELAEYTELRGKLVSMRNPDESELTELAKLKARLDQLKLEEKKITEAEKLIEQKENNGQSIDE